MPHTLLLADDSVTIQRVIELTFADEDIRVIAVSDGAQAVREAQAERPDIILADVGMPEMDGYEVAAFVKRTAGLSHIPVLLLTGAFEPIDEDRARAVGCDGVLVKPFEPQMVISRVKDLIAGRPVNAASPRANVLAPLAAPPAPITAPAPATDEYFDRLDAALASFDSAAAPSAPASAPSSSVGAPSASGSAPSAAVSAPSSSVGAPSASETAPSAPVGAPSASVSAPSASGIAPSASVSAPSASETDPSASVSAPSSILAEAFEALLAAEQGRPLDSTAAHKLGSSATLIDHITRQVIERLADERMRDAVLDVAERLVREEIARIKSAAQ